MDGLYAMLEWFTLTYNYARSRYADMLNVIQILTVETTGIGGYVFIDYLGLQVSVCLPSTRIPGLQPATDKTERSRPCSTNGSRQNRI